MENARRNRRPPVPIQRLTVDFLKACFWFLSLGGHSGLATNVTRFLSLCERLSRLQRSRSRLVCGKSKAHNWEPT